jgi:hypothetical protein
MGYFYDEDKLKYKTVKVTVVSTVTFLTFILTIMFALPRYNVWNKGQSGRAALSEAQYSKQVQLEEAKANLESEKLNAQAEIERAKGAAEAIRIEGGQLTDNYIKYLWVRQLNTGAKQLIYVPTEAGLPILEAGRISE